ncbi:NAD(P)-binding protein [Mycena maculata]|uniref:NAD(P)-binding protein n=1 Tax=Mycena maculata TaxID=230809 RepID=A0AAD7NCE3_9AGAR|nr:NAD(P)-binding protein [Mycena maculata]
MAPTFSAWFATKKGPPSVGFQLKTGLPIPDTLPKDHVLVKVQAIALNPYIYKMNIGLPNFVAKRPHVIERDMAGIVVNPNGTEFVAGDLVFGSNAGAMSEYMVIPSRSLVLQPPNVTPLEAAGLAIVTLTANQALKDLQVKAGQTVFINGGSSAVGLSAIQIAKSLGCNVVATASARNKDVLLNLGVDEFIDYTRAPLVEQLAKRDSPPFDAVFDAVGLKDPALYLNCPSYLAPRGMYVSAGGFPGSRKDLAGVLRQVFSGKLLPTWLGGVPRKFGFVTCPSAKKDFEEVRTLVAEGAVKPIVDSVHSFDRAGVMAAYDKLMTNRAVGKVVIKIEDSTDKA